MGVGEMGVGEMGVGEMGVGKMAPIYVDPGRPLAQDCPVSE